MDFVNRVCQRLHEEHRSTIALMERLEQIIARHSRDGLPDIADHGVTQFLTDLAVGVEGEIDRHFAFEENFLFTYLDELGDAAIGAHLSSEHEAMRPLGVQITTSAVGAIRDGFDEVAWTKFRTLGQELSERMLMHVQKEEMALLPLLEEAMDAETEDRLLLEYLGETV